MKLLIVDDEKSIRTLLAEKAQDWGYEVFLASDGDSAWKILQVIKEPIIILIDWIMPGVDGVELCARVKGSKNLGHNHVIMMTAQKSDEEDVVVGFGAGADDFLIKPFNEKELKCRLSVGSRILAYQHQLEERNTALQETTKIMENILNDLSKANAKLKTISMLDELTGIANRRALEECLEKEWRKALREQEVLTFMMLDVDFFKLYNDNYGHQAGDICLQKIARVLADNVKRGGDLTARYGGEEFAIVLFATDSQGGQIVAERIRQEIEKLAIYHEFSSVAPYVTVSLGIATAKPNGTSNYTELIHQADEALYQAKREGRNRWLAVE